MSKKTPLVISYLLLAVVLAGCITIPTPLPTQTPTAIPTATTQPTARPTALPGPAPITGWKQFDGAGISLWLPESYVGGDLSKHIQAITNALILMDKKYQTIADNLRANTATFPLWAFDTTPAPSGALTNVSVVTEPVPENVSIDTYLDSTTNGAALPSNVQITDRKKVNLDYFEAGRLVLSLDLDGVKMKEVMYVVKDNVDFWVITYGAGAADFDSMLPAFDKSANTFRINR